MTIDLTQPEFYTHQRLKKKHPSVVVFVHIVRNSLLGNRSRRPFVVTDLILKEVWGWGWRGGGLQLHTHVKDRVVHVRTLANPACTVYSDKKST